MPGSNFKAQKLSEQDKNRFQIFTQITLKRSQVSSFWVFYNFEDFKE